MTHEAGEPGTIEIWLTRGPSEQIWRVVNLRLKSSGQNERILLDTPQELSRTFQPEIADALTARLDGIKETSVFSHSAFSLAIKGLQLGGLRILARVGTNGPASASVRFARAVGDLDAVLRPDMTGGAPYPMDVNEITVPVLAELLCPALEVFDHILEHGLSEHDARVLAARVKTMRAKRDELSDYIGLLTSFIEAKPDRAAAAIPGPTQATPEITLYKRDALPRRDIRWDPRNGPVRGARASVLHGHHEEERAT